MEWENVDDWSVGVDLELGVSLNPFKNCWSYSSL